MKTFFMLCAAVLISAAALSQPASVLVGNNTGCSVVVYLYASSPFSPCAANCNTTAICVFPGTTVSVPPCGPSNWQWDYARVVPTTDDCATPCTSGYVAVSPSGCIPAVASSTHCHCGPYTADFSAGPSVLKIY